MSSFFDLIKEVPQYRKELLKPGDWLTIIVGACFIIASFALLTPTGQADKAIVHHNGIAIAEAPLTEHRLLSINTDIGTTVIEIDKGKARVASDPGPRQYCVKKGWLTEAGSLAICAPSKITLSLSGKAYDSLTY